MTIPSPPLGSATFPESLVPILLPVIVFVVALPERTDAGQRVPRDHVVAHDIRVAVGHDKAVPGIWQSSVAAESSTNRVANHDVAVSRVSNNRDPAQNICGDHIRVHAIARSSLNSNAVAFVAQARRLRPSRSQSYCSQAPHCSPCTSIPSLGNFRIFSLRIAVSLAIHSQSVDCSSERRSIDGNGWRRARSWLSATININRFCDIRQCGG